MQIDERGFLKHQCLLRVQQQGGRILMHNGSPRKNGFPLLATYSRVFERSRLNQLQTRGKAAAALTAFFPTNFCCFQQNLLSQAGSALSEYLGFDDNELAEQRLP